MNLLACCRSSLNVPNFILLFALVLGTALILAACEIRVLALVARRGPLVGKPWSLFLSALSAPMGLNLLWLSSECFPNWQGAAVFFWLVIASLLIAAACFIELEPCMYDTLAVHRTRTVWLQDVLLTVLNFGLAQMVLWNSQSLLGGDVWNIALVATLMIATLASFLVAADLCRRSVLGVNPGVRGFMFFALTLLAPFAIPAFGLAWLIWRRALTRARIESIAMAQPRAR